MSNWGLNQVCLTITTQTGCQDSVCKPVFIGYDPCMVSLWSEVTFESYPGAGDGSVDLHILGGMPPFSFYWSNGATTEDLNGLDTGMYVVHMTDGNGCLLEHLSIVGVLTIVPVTQVIDLPPGWSIFSTYVEPFLPDMEDLFQPIEQNVVIVKSWQGQVYWPAYNLDAINDIDVTRGYQIRISGSGNVQLSVFGYPVIPALTPIDLPQGWSIIGYLRQVPGAVTAMFSSITAPPQTEGILKLVKDGSGQVYWPYYALDLIGNMVPGKGYQVNLNTPVQFTYPGN
jgi:hypothetical protein